MDNESFVRSIYVTERAGEPMKQVEHAYAEAGRGLAGDRYAEGLGAYSTARRQKIRQLSLIASEAIEAANLELHLPFGEEETRRNIVTYGIELNELVGKEFAIGSVMLRGTELCDPCRRPEKLTGKAGFEEAFQDRGGLRAEVLTSGLIAVGHAIEL